MKLTIERAILLKSLSHVQSIVERKGTVPILANIKLDASANALEITATDTDVAVVEHMDATIHTPGETTLPAHMFYDIVRKLPEGSEVNLHQEAAEKMIISAGKSRFSLATLPAADFPSISEGTMEHSFVLTNAECKALFHKTRFAMSTEDARYYLNGIYLHAIDHNESPVLRAVATDGHRLVRQEVDLPAGAAGMPGVIVPRKTVAEFSKLLDDKEVDVKISLSQNKIKFTIDSVVLVSKLIDGTFPDYERVIPTQNDRLLELSTDGLLKAVDRVSVMAMDRTRGVKLHLDAKELTIRTADTEQGSAQESLEGNYSYEPMEIGFNGRYLLETLSQIESDTVQLMLGNEMGQVLLRDQADPNALYVLMPMRV